MDQCTTDLGNAHITSFIVRVRQDGLGHLSGVVERVRDGAKTPLPPDLATLGSMIARMLPLRVPADGAGPVVVERASDGTGQALTDLGASGGAPSPGCSRAPPERRTERE